MRSALLSAVALLAVSPTTVVSGKAQAAAVVSSPASQASAVALADTVAPAEIMIPMEVEQAKRAILALPTVDADARQLEQDYPGIYAAIWEAVAPEVRRQSEADHPGYRSALVALYIKRLTDAEAQGLLKFYRSPTGQKMIRTMYGGFDITPMVAEIVKSESGNVSASQLQSAVDEVRRKTVQQIGTEDHESLIALAAAIDLRKAKDIGAETQKLTLDWVNKSDPDGEARLSEIMLSASEKFMAAHPEKD